MTLTMVIFTFNVFPQLTLISGNESELEMKNRAKTSRNLDFVFLMKCFTENYYIMYLKIPIVLHYS